MGKGTTRFLNIGLILVSVFCIIIFTVQTSAMNMMGEDAIRQLGVFYMSGMTEQVTSHFGTIIEFRLAQVEAVVNSVPPGRAKWLSAMETELVYNARAAGFEYLAFYTDDGDFQMLFGSQVTPDVPEDLRRSVQGGKNNVCAGRDAAGTHIVLVGIPAIYPMEDGRTSAALVAGLPTSYLSDTLESSVNSGIVEYAIFRNDGSYVLQSNRAIQEENYFERVADTYETYGGKSPEQYAGELRAAVEAGTTYTSEVLIAGERWNVYCVTLPNSQWNLMLKIPHTTLDETVNLLQRRWVYISIGGCALIVCALLLVFVGYYHLTREQVKALNEARESAEQARLSAERSSKAKSEFLSNMSHDIRTPMNGIMGMTAIAISSLDDPPRVRSCLKKIHVSSRHLLGLITDMLDMSKIGSGSLPLNVEPISLREVLQNIMTIIQPQVQEKNQNFNMYVHGVYHENVCADRVRLSQILLNIIGNSVKFTPPGGFIEAELYEKPSPKGEGYIRSCLSIRDNGIGMSKEFQKKVFEAFTREDDKRVDKEAGAGMGLAITKYIVDAMGGTIEVESEQGKGSCFHITLDLELTNGQKDLRLPQRNVLVLDSDAQAGRLAVGALESIGLRAEAASSREAALQLLEERRSPSGAFNLILLDHDTYGEDGIQSAKELSDRFGLPVVLLTNGEWDELEARSQGSGIRGFISKPLFRSGLYYGLRPILEAEAASPEQGGEKAADLTGRRILIAEDNELNWEIANELLSEAGLEMDWAENGQLCVEKYKASAAGWYDAILMDIRMPVMSGIEAAEAIRKLPRPDARTIPIVAVSADAFQDDIQKCLDAGMNAHTPKPLDADKVVALLSQYLSGPAEREEKR
ncbi:MAG: response regulator [Oscillospiraceae bacterium]|nr:response regulator [Oscillospiraceae bacterium]